MAARRDVQVRGTAAGAYPCRHALLPAFGIALMLGVTACDGADEVPVAMRVVGGDPDKGAVAIARYDCGVCHVIPGIADADGTVGPPLTDFGHRTYIAGVVPNRPGNLTRWIQDPPRIAPDTAMPDLGVSDEDARHIAAYLYTLR